MHSAIQVLSIMYHTAGLRQCVRVQSKDTPHLYQKLLEEQVMLEDPGLELFKIYGIFLKNNT